MAHEAKKWRQDIFRHPLGVKPTGNALLDVVDVGAHRVEHMGALGLLNDELLMYVLQELPRKDLLAVGHTCKALYAYSWFDELWKQIVHDEAKPVEEFTWRGSWRKSALQIDSEADIDAEGAVYSDFLHRPYELSQVDYSSLVDPVAGPVSALIPEYSEDDVTVELFDEKLWKRPFVTKLKKPIARWKVDDLIEQFGNEVFRQEFMDWPLKVYNDYMRKNCDETPLYLFDCKSRAHSKLNFDVPLPHVFGKDRDFFTLFGDDRPDHQWLIIGPARSGSTFHKDPNATSAWNSVISGRKYWIMFPADEPPPGVWTDHEQSEVTAPVSLAEWFSSGLYRAAVKVRGFHHAVTGPGEVMYVPSGWWHAVVNLEECVALTGNFVTNPQLKTVLNFLRTKPDQVSGFANCENVYERFLSLLGDKRPDFSNQVTKHTWSEVSREKVPFTFGFSA